MIQITAGLICFAVIGIIWTLTVMARRIGQKETWTCTRSGEIRQANGKIGLAEAYFIVPVAKRLLLWIEKRGRSP